MSELPNGWKMSKLGEVAKWGSGGTPTSGRSDYYDGDIPWAIIGDLNDSYLHTTEKRITCEGLNASSAKLVPEGAVLIAMYGSIGKLGIAGIPMATNQAIAFALPNEKMVLRRFLFWYLRSQRELLLWSGKGATQQNISQTLLKAWQIPLPPIAEQQQIVEILEEHLSRLDAALADIKQAREKALRLRRAMLVSRFDSSNRTSIPVRPLGEIADLSSGPAFKSALFGEEGSGTRLLRGDNIGTGSLRWDKTRTWSDDRLHGYEHLYVDIGDIILAMDRPLISTGMKIAQVRSEDVPALLVQRVARIRARKDVLSGYLFAALQSPQFESHLQLDQVGTQIPHITLQGIRSFAMPVPSLEEQELILQQLDEVLGLCAQIVTVCEGAEKRGAEFRRSLLQAAFIGQLTREAVHV